MEEHKVEHFNGVVWFKSLGLLGWCGRSMHQHSTGGIRRKIRRRIRRWHSTCWHMAQCEGVGWLLGWFALMTHFVTKGEKCDDKEWDLNYEHPFPRISDIRECMTLWRLILRILGCSASYLDHCTTLFAKGLNWMLRGLKVSCLIIVNMSNFFKQKNKMSTLWKLE
jgi:hypothetical protein